MTFGACIREKELERQLELGHWPDACPADLRTHADACPSCRELILLKQAFRRERARALAQPRLESPGALWWRAQLRRRREAMEKIGRPIFGAQIFAVTLALVAAAAFLFSQRKNGAAWLGWLSDLPRSLHLEALLPTAWQNSAGPLWLLGFVIAVLALAGGAIAYAASDKR